jgi:uncharacterized protein YndB with AHSA1/START domain
MIGLATTQLPADKPQIITSRVIAASREIIWKVLTTPEDLQHFWGPDGFTNTYAKFDLRVGGEALFTMHGPDGTNYPNRFKFLVIDAPRLLVFDHDGGEDGPDMHPFRGELELFEEVKNTRIELRLNERNIAARDEIAKFAVEGGRQNLERLADYAAPIANPLNKFVIERSYPVSQERLFKACSQVEHLRHWMSPAGMKVVKAEQNLKPGGTYHYGLEMPDGNTMWGKAHYKEITPNSRLVYVQHFSDKDGGVTTHPMAPTWPMEMTTIFDFIPEGENQTCLRITWLNTRITEAEIKTFEGAHAGMTQGWTGSLDNLQNYLSQNQE